jgi:LysM repeat protein
MAISVGRLSQHDLARAGRFERYAVRITAFAGYAAAVAVALVLLAPVLFANGPAPAARRAPTSALTVTVQRGESLELVAARNGVSLTRVLALNPELDPFVLEPGTRIRIR